MDVLVMCGGRGSRLGAAREKPLVRVGGAPMVDRVVDALTASRAGRVFAAVSPQAPATAAHLSVPTVRTPGDGYVPDLEHALADARIERPVLTVAADLPLLSDDAVDRVLAAHEVGSLTVAVPVARKRALGISRETRFVHDGRTVAPTGCNVVDEGPDGTAVLDDERLAVNVNRPTDLAAARRLFWGHDL